MLGADFEALRRFLLQEAGISLRDNQAYQVDRLKSLLEETECRDVFALLYKAKKDRDVKQRIIELYTTNETSFFRDIKVFNFFRTDVFPRLIESRERTKQIRILSAASSSGQEAYSLAMILYDHFPETRDWNIVIQGLDIDNNMVQKAREGWYSQLEVNRGLATRLLFRHFKREGRGYSVKDYLKQMVRFSQGNLFEVEKGFVKYDIILCRNVLIYFTEEDQQRLLVSLSKKLRYDGFFFLGASEIGRMIPQNHLEHHKKGNVVWYQVTS